jgi:hypothetical protein
MLYELVTMKNIPVPIRWNHLNEERIKIDMHYSGPMLGLPGPKFRPK